MLLLDGYRPELLPPRAGEGHGIHLPAAAAGAEREAETANLMLNLREQGFTLIGGGADSHEMLDWLSACGAAFMSGTLTGVPVSEDELIRDSLARERQL